MPAHGTVQVGFLYWAPCLESPGPCSSWNEECVGPRECAYLELIPQITPGPQNFLTKWLELAPRVGTVLFAESTFLNTNCAIGMHTFRLEEWPTHYSSHAMCGYSVKRTEVSTRVCLWLLSVLDITKSMSKRQAWLQARVWFCS